jgi:hypothetical protein
MTASNAGGSKSTSVNVSIGKRIIDSILVTDIPEQDTLGAIWDPDLLGPDMKMKFGKTASATPIFDYTNVIPNVIVPRTTITYRNSTPTELTAEGWYFDFYDEDNGTDTYMGRVWFNAGLSKYAVKSPLTIEATKKAGAASVIWKIKLYYHLEP